MSPDLIKRRRELPTIEWCFVIPACPVSSVIGDSRNKAPAAGYIFLFHHIYFPLQGAAGKKGTKGEKGQKVILPVYS